MSFRAFVFGGLGLRVQIYPELCLGRGFAVLGTVDHASLSVWGNRSLTSRALQSIIPVSREKEPPLDLGLRVPRDSNIISRSSDEENTYKAPTKQ